MLNIPSIKIVKNRKRVGRGGVHGRHTAGRGQKGQKSRSGYKSPRPGFEGGRMPLSRRLPKLKGFRRGSFESKFHDLVINLSSLDKVFADGDTVSIETIIEKGFNVKMTKVNRIKVLGGGELTKKLNIVDLDITASAKEKVEKAGGSVK